MEIKNRIDIPIKYQLLSHRILKSYPNEDDILYDIVSYAISIMKKRTDINDIKILYSSIKDIFINFLNDEFKEKLSQILSKLKNDEYIDNIDGYIYIKEKSIKKFFIIDR